MRFNWDWRRGELQISIDQDCRSLGGVWDSEHPTEVAGVCEGGSEPPIWGCSGVQKKNMHYTDRLSFK